MPDDEETQHEWASGTSTPYPRRGSREQLPELGSRAIKAGFNRLLADPQNHRSVGLAHFVDAATKQYLAQTLRQLVDRPTNPRRSPNLQSADCQPLGADQRAGARQRTSLNYSHKCASRLQ